MSQTSHTPKLLLECCFWGHLGDGRQVVASGQYAEVHLADFCCSVLSGLVPKVSGSKSRESRGYRDCCSSDDARKAHEKNKHHIMAWMSM